MPKKSSNYNAKSVQVLTGIEHIRKRPGMYIGAINNGTFNAGVFHLFKEVLDNSVDEYLNDYLEDGITIKYDEDENKMTIIDTGRGIPVDYYKDGRPVMEVLVCEVNSGGKFDNNAFKISAGTHGVGISCVNALSKYMKIISTRDGYDYTMEFSRGYKTTEYKKTKSKRKTSGTIVEFIPDEEIFKEYYQFDIDAIKEHLSVRAYANAGLNLTFINGNDVTKYYHPNGIVDYCRDLNKKPIIKDIIYFSKKDSDDNFYEIAMSYQNTDFETIKSFVNGIAASGTAETGFKMAASDIFSKYIKKNNLLPAKMKDVEIKGDDVRMGIVALVNVRHKTPIFKNQTKDELSNPEVMGFVKKITNEYLTEWLDKNKDDARKICNRIIAFSKGRLEANKYKDKVINLNNSSAGLSFSSKFVNCNSNNPEEKELYIAEGDSASGNIISCRDPMFQASFSLKGKPLNSYGITNNRLLANDEFNEIIKIIFNTNDIKKVDYDKVQFHKIIVISDADMDGLHIRSLMLLFFWEHFRELFNRGYVYIGLSPKYRGLINKKYVYFNDDKELIDYRYKIMSKDIKVNNKDISLKKIIEISNDYKNSYENILNEYSVHRDIMDTILYYKEDAFDMFNDLFKYNKKLDKFTGMYENFFQDFIFTDLLNDVKKLYSDNISYTYQNKKEESNLYDFILFIEKQYKFPLFYNKGLGESSVEEFEQCMNVDQRRLIQIIPEKDTQSIDECMKNMFGNDTEPRKKFIIDTLS